jgi:hypothetical protein
VHSQGIVIKDDSDVTLALARINYSSFAPLLIDVHFDNTACRDLADPATNHSQDTK